MKFAVQIIQLFTAYLQNIVERQNCFQNNTYAISFKNFSFETF